jgi:serum/glucocorticoid-regulated kinase 2
LQNLPIRDREEAQGLGNKLMEKGYFKSFDNKPFKDGDNFYFFSGSTTATATANDQESALPTVSLADFDLLQTVGKGGFGSKMSYFKIKLTQMTEVMKVAKKDTNKIYAMKIIHKTKISGQRQLQCLIAEKNIMLNDNPFLVHLHYSFQTDEKLYFVMDYISGGDLAYHLEQKGRFSEKEVRFIGAEIVLALAHLHSAAVIMRDMKLENILLDKEGHVCITDFVRK